MAVLNVHPKAANGGKAGVCIKSSFPPAKKNNQHSFIFCQTCHTISNNFLCTGAHY